MNYVYFFTFVVIAFLVIIITMIAIYRLHHRRKTSFNMRLYLDNERVEPLGWGFSANWPIVDWIADHGSNALESLPGIDRPIGTLVGIIALIISGLCLIFTSIITSVLGVFFGFLAGFYNGGGVERGIQKKSIWGISTNFVVSLCGFLLIVPHARTIWTILLDQLVSQ